MEVAKNFVNLLDTKDLMVDMLNSGVAKDINSALFDVGYDYIGKQVRKLWKQ